MAKLNLTDQDKAKQQIYPKLLQMKTELDKRKEMWDKLPMDRRIDWIVSGQDPILVIAVDVYKYLDEFFGGLNDI